MLPIFPEGHIVPELGRRLDDIKPGTAYLALHSGVPVIPAYLSDTGNRQHLERRSFRCHDRVWSSETRSIFPTFRPIVRPTRRRRPRLASDSSGPFSPCKRRPSPIIENESTAVTRFLDRHLERSSAVCSLAS